VTHSKINKNNIFIHTVVTSPNVIQQETWYFSALFSDVCTFSKCYCDSANV